MITQGITKTLLSGNAFSDILGQEEAKDQLKSALLTNRNIIIAGPPGIGKTTLAKNLARLLPEIAVNDCQYNCLPERPMCPHCRAHKATKRKTLSGEERFVRVQGSPDLTAEDLIGDIDPIKALKFGPLSLEAFTPGKIFRANNGILFFDEINRCPEKLQNAMLQVLEEKKATINSYMVDIEADFIFVGTMNPKDTSTEKLSDVFMDRFDLVYMGYPESDETEKRIVQKKGKKLACFPEPLLSATIRFVRSLREDKNLEKKPSVRATIGLYERAQANATLRNRKAVDFEDVARAAISVLAHRIELNPSTKYLISHEEYIRQSFSSFFEDRQETGGCR